MASLKEETAMAALTEDVIQTIQSALKLLTGHKRRRFQAETALKYWTDELAALGESNERAQNSKRPR